MYCGWRDLLLAGVTLNDQRGWMNRLQLMRRNNKRGLSVFSLLSKLNPCVKGWCTCSSSSSDALCTCWTYLFLLNPNVCAGVVLHHPQDRLVCLAFVLYFCFELMEQQQIKKRERKKELCWMVTSPFSFLKRKNKEKKTRKAIRNRRRWQSIRRCWHPSHLSSCSFKGLPLRPAYYHTFTRARRAFRLCARRRL